MGLFVDEENWTIAYDAYEDLNLTNTTNSTSHQRVDHVIRAISVVTCSLSIMGSLAIIISYAHIRDIRSKARELLVHLSIMDLTYSAANLIGALLPYDKYLLHETSGSAHDNIERLCKAQAFFAAYGTIGSFLWTLGLAVYLYYRFVSGNVRLTKRAVNVLYVVCYILPLYVSLWSLLRDHYGYPTNQEFSGGWCTLMVGYGTEESERYDHELLLFMVSDIWILLTFITMVPIYVIIHCQVKEEVSLQCYVSLVNPTQVLMIFIQCVIVFCVPCFVCFYCTVGLCVTYKFYKITKFVN